MELASQIGRDLVVLGVVTAACVAVGFLVAWAARRLAIRLDISVLSGAVWRSPVVVIVVLVGWVLLNRRLDREWAPEIEVVLGIALTTAVAWLFVVLAYTLEKAALARFPETDITDPRSRHARTQISMLRRLLVSLIALVAVCSILATIPMMRELGLSLIATTGVLGIIAGLAAQTTLGNVFAGLQVAFTDGIRVGDVVQIDQHWGHIEEITLTYVVLRVWDGTTVILPCTFFTTTPYQNWTHTGARIVVQLDLAADWSVDVDDLRTTLRETLNASTYWDGQDINLVVEAATPSHLTLRAFASTPRGDLAASLVWEIREALVRRVRELEAVPRSRTELSGGPTAR